MNKPVQEAPKKAKSLDEIAAIMAANTQARMAQRAGETPESKDDKDTKGATENVDQHLGAEAGAGDTPVDRESLAGTGDNSGDDDASQDQQDDDGAAELADALDPNTQLGDDDDDDAAAQEAASDPQQLEFEIDDDDLVELEGGSTVSLGDLKRNYNADTEAAKNLKETTEQHKAASVERAKALEESQRLNVAAQEMFKNMTDVITQPLVSPPPAELKNTNPAQYIQHLEAYQQDQQRIAASKESILNAMQEHRKEQSTLLENKKQHELQLLANKIPALRSSDAATRKAASKDILDSAEYYGFSPNEVNLAADHRLYQMAHDAQQYRKIMSRSGKQGEQLVKEAQEKVQRTRTLRTKGTTANNRLSAQAKQQRILKSKAKKTGRTDDVAAVIAAKKQATR